MFTVNLGERYMGVHCTILFLGVWHYPKFREKWSTEDLFTDRDLPFFFLDSRSPWWKVWIPMRKKRMKWLKRWVKGKASEGPSPHPPTILYLLSSLSPTDGSSDPWGGAQPAGGGSVCLRGWFPSEEPEQYPNPLIPASPRSNISPTSSSYENSWIPCFTCSAWIPLPAHQGAGLCQWRWCGPGWGREAGREGGKFARYGQYPQYVNLFTSGGWEHGLGKFLSILDTFIFPESNSASDSARPRRGLFGTWKLERDKQVRLLGNLLLGVLTSLRTFCNFGWEKGTNLIFAILMAQGPCLPAWLLFVFFSQVASTSQQPSYVDLPPAPELDWMETEQPLTFIGHHQV